MSAAQKVGERRNTDRRLDIPGVADGMMQSQHGRYFTPMYTFPHVVSSHPVQLCLYDHLHLCTFMYKKPDIICNQRLHFSPSMSNRHDITGWERACANLTIPASLKLSLNSKCYILLRLASKTVESQLIYRDYPQSQNQHHSYTIKRQMQRQEQIFLQDYRPTGRTAHTVLLGVGKL